MRRGGGGGESCSFWCGSTYVECPYIHGTHSQVLHLFTVVRHFCPLSQVWGCHVDGWSSSGRPNSAARRRQVQKGMEWRQRLDAKEVDEKRRAASAVDDAGGSSPVRLASATSVAAAAEASKLAYAKMKQKRHMQASGGASRDTGSKLQHNAQRRSILFNFVGAVAMR